MAMKINRQEIHSKYQCHCGYCGKQIEMMQMQIDHITPKWRWSDKTNDLDNLMPTCRRCNHYKRGKDLEQFRNYMATLHERIHNDYINKVAIDYGIVTIKQFDGVFYFEKHTNNDNKTLGNETP